jgi:hypothetical protein
VLSLGVRFELGVLERRIFPSILLQDRTDVRGTIDSDCYSWERKVRVYGWLTKRQSGA